METNTCWVERSHSKALFLYCDRQRAMLEDMWSEAFGDLHILQHGFKAAQSLIKLLASTLYALQGKDERFKKKGVSFRLPTNFHT